jgi:hypothetical protein
MKKWISLFLLMVLMISCSNNTVSSIDNNENEALAMMRNAVPETYKQDKQLSKQASSRPHALLQIPRYAGTWYDTNAVSHYEPLEGFTVIIQDANTYQYIYSYTDANGFLEAPTHINYPVNYYIAFACSGYFYPKFGVSGDSRDVAVTQVYRNCSFPLRITYAKGISPNTNNAYAYSYYALQRAWDDYYQALGLSMQTFMNQNGWGHICHTQLLDAQGYASPSVNEMWATFKPSNYKAPNGYGPAQHALFRCIWHEFGHIYLYRGITPMAESTRPIDEGFASAMGWECLNLEYGAWTRHVGGMRVAQSRGPATYPYMPIFYDMVDTVNNVTVPNAPDIEDYITGYTYNDMLGMVRHIRTVRDMYNYLCNSAKPAGVTNYDLDLYFYAYEDVLDRTHGAQVPFLWEDM